MSSGSYFPPPVRAVCHSEKEWKRRKGLGVPTVGDRIAQMVVKQLIETDLEPIFLPDSDGYRPRNGLWTPWGSRVSGAGSMTCP